MLLVSVVNDQLKVMAYAFSAHLLNDQYAHLLFLENYNLANEHSCLVQSSCWSVDFCCWQSQSYDKFGYRIILLECYISHEVVVARYESLSLLHFVIKQLKCSIFQNMVGDILLVLLQCHSCGSYLAQHYIRNSATSSFCHH